MGQEKGSDIGGIDEIIEGLSSGKTLGTTSVQARLGRPSELVTDVQNGVVHVVREGERWKLS